MGSATRSRDRRLEKQERLRRRAAISRAVQRNESQARGAFERGQMEHVLQVTSLMLRGQTLRYLTPDQVPLVYWRGRAFEAMERLPEAAACYRALSAWNGGAHDLGGDAMPYVDRAMSRLLALPPEQWSDGAPDVTPATDRRVFPPSRFGPATIIGAALGASVLVVVAIILIVIFKIY